MKITGASVLQGLTRPTDVRNSKRNEETKRSPDVFEASEKAKDYNVARKGAAAASDVREAIVADLQARIKSGEYNVSAYDIASKLVDARI
ncbi:MAG: flagellar biosynthesis anti-sigma factor FlgM [Defluviitaleaceae bacterium]|nr:flagellar biosynthesis anti-sigma factor FlgM [Defluviitaleaceae bacterium]